MVKIRKLTVDDVEQVYKIECESFSKPWSRNAIEKETENPLAYYIVAEYEEKVVGYAGMWQVMGEGQITNIAVAKEYRGQKIGSKLVNKLIQDARENQLEMLLLEVRKSNEAAKRLYEKNRFIEIGNRKAYYQDPTEDAILMEFKIL